MASAVKLFEAELRKRKIPFERNEDGLYVVFVGELKLEISLENVARDLARDRDPGRIVVASTSRTRGRRSVRGQSSRNMSLAPTISSTRRSQPRDHAVPA